MTVELVAAADAGVAAPNVSLSVREHGGLAIGGVVSPTAELGWGEGPGERILRFEVDRLPLAAGPRGLRRQQDRQAGQRDRPRDGPRARQPIPRTDPKPTPTQLHSTPPVTPLDGKTPGC